MRLTGKIIHVLALGLWFGSVVFFTFVVAPDLFNTFLSIGERDRADRPYWFPLPEYFDKDPANWEQGDQRLFKTPREVRHEQGFRAAGAAVGSMFDWYFMLQNTCGLLAFAPAVNWWRAEPQRRVHRIRIFVLSVALVTVMVGYSIARKVSYLMQERNFAVETVLRVPQPSAAMIQDASAKHHDFIRWHVYSLFLNFGTLALVTVGMGLTARLPGELGLPRTSATQPP